MNSIPPDWQDDRKLWNALQHLPKANPPSNFSFVVQEKINLEKSRRPHFWNRFKLFLPQPAHRKAWAWGLSLTAGCLMVMFYFSRSQTSEHIAVPSQMVVANSKSAPVNDEIETILNSLNIDDLDVILHLDELEVL